MDAVWCVLIGYIIGNINPSYIIARIRGFDIRKRGSGNAGASNAVITMGKAVGIFSAVFDIAKAYIATYLAEMFFPEMKHAFAIVGASCIIGHIFPLLMGFRGGKGLACLGGVILSYDLRVFAIMLAVELLLVLAIDYICIVPITAAVIFPIIYGVMSRNIYGALIFAIPSVIMLFKHVENIKRIRNGTEMHLSFLWRREEEIERVQQNQQEQESLNPKA